MGKDHGRIETGRETTLLRDCRSVCDLGGRVVSGAAAAAALSALDSVLPGKSGISRSAGDGDRRFTASLPLWLNDDGTLLRGAKGRGDRQRAGAGD